MSQNDSDTSDSEWNPTVVDRDGDPVDIEADREYRNKANQRPAKEDHACDVDERTWTARDVRQSPLIEPAECWAVQRLKDDGQWTVAQVGRTIDSLELQPASLRKHARGDCSCGFLQERRPSVVRRGEALADQWDAQLREEHLTLPVSSVDQGEDEEAD